MTDQLRDLMTRIADQAPPGEVDLTVWARARRARRRSQSLATAGAAAAVGALVLATGVGVSILGGPGPVDKPAENPATGERGAGIPSSVHGIRGDGGLEPERDLAVGHASVAVANPTGAFVVTADDGAYHRLALPGFDGAVYDERDVRKTGMVGLTLSPDGTKLAYGWHAALPEETGQSSGFVRSGVRILDLLTGRVETVTDNGETPWEFGYIASNPDFPAWVVVPYGIRWSADSRYVTYDQVWRGAGRDEDAPNSPAPGLQDAYHDSRSNSAASVYNTATRELFRVNRYSMGLGWTGWPQMVTRSGLVATAGGGGLLFAERDRQRRERGLPEPQDYYDHPYVGWTSGLFASGGRVLLEPAAPGDLLLAVTLGNGSRERLQLDTGPARVELLGWVAQEQALAMVHRGVGDTEWEADADLVLLDTADATVETTVVGQVDAEGTDSSFSFATDFATVKRPTHDFAVSAAGTPTDAQAASPDAQESRADDWSGRALLVGGVLVAAALGLLLAAAARRRLPQ